VQAEHDCFVLYPNPVSRPLDDSHRVFWAIATGRHDLAKKIWRRCKDRFMVAFVAGYVYKFSFNSLAAGSNRQGAQGAHLNPLGLFLNPLGLFLRTSITFIWRILSAFLRA
jgi:hypothetical protein